MAHDTLESKALRLLAEGRLCVLLVDAEHIEARVRGSEAEHVTGYRRGGWWCSCEAHRFGRRCSHILALQRVTVRPVHQRLAADSTRAAMGRSA
jgi:hypothetical protein